MTTQPPVRVGMRVVGADGGDVGTVKEVRDRDFLIDRPMRRDIYAPFEAIQSVTGDTARLNIPSGAVDNTDWQKPSLP
jgi:Uncharacterized protein conserved in bacteria (DUF2171)